MKTSWRRLQWRRLEDVCTGLVDDLKVVLKTSLVTNFSSSQRYEDVFQRCSLKTYWRRQHRSWRRLEGSPEDVPVVTGFNCSQRYEDVFKRCSLKTSWRRLHRSWRRLEGSPEDVPVVNGFNCSQRYEDVFKKSSMKTSWRRLQILHLPTGTLTFGCIVFSAAIYVSIICDHWC